MKQSLFLAAFLAVILPVCGFADGGDGPGNSGVVTTLSNAPQDVIRFSSPFSSPYYGRSGNSSTSWQQSNHDVIWKSIRGHAPSSATIEQWLSTVTGLDAQGVVTISVQKVIAVGDYSYIPGGRAFLNQFPHNATYTQNHTDFFEGSPKHAAEFIRQYGESGTLTNLEVRYTPPKAAGRTSVLAIAGAAAVLGARSAFTSSVAQASEACRQALDHAPSGELPVLDMAQIIEGSDSTPLPGQAGKPKCVGVNNSDQPERAPALVQNAASVTGADQAGSAD